ncbi:MAG TPA: hypothetical protein PLX17_03185 [Chitinophagaceae bacterium]|jgi:hypothetical protein|nr:hypothetical protein [Chitinophagaceae bacterium]
MQLNDMELCNPIARIIFLYLHHNEMDNYNIDFLLDGAFIVALQRWE